MKIQFVSLKKENIMGEYDYTCSTLKTPNSLDSFDINIFSLQDADLWRTREDSITCLDSTNDFVSINKMILNSNRSINIIALPQNYYHKYNRYYSDNKYYSYYELKDKLDNLQKNILSKIIPSHLVGGYSLFYENSETELSNKMYRSAFCFINTQGEITRSNGGNKTTTIRNENLILTTLDLHSPQTTMDDFIDGIGLGDKKVDFPKWLQELNCFDDEEQNNLIDETKNEINELNKKIEQANLKLQENLKYKSILFTNGDELVSVVFKILEKILSCDLSSFVDEGKQDFLIKKDGITFIGEIKGITSNIRSENVSQLDVHYQSYLEELDDNGISENVKPLLIINPFRTKSLIEREEVNDKQINLAKRNGCLIITTETLLKIFEKFLNGEVSTEKIVALLSNEIGLANIQSFE